MNLDLINAALVVGGTTAVIGGGWRLANWFVHLGAPETVERLPQVPRRAIRARATVARPLPTVEGEILPPADTRKELTR